ncbi:GGDEF domain-containing protein [Kerstersia similis]|uniref:GGDEF domain-containing protein n=1 Tax=Kerstersia similis TaxID=206505 RepID=UPI0039EF1BB3
MPDPVSILIVTIISALLSLGVLGSMLSARVAGVRDWVVGCSLSIVSLLLVCTQAYGWPRAISVVASNQLLMLGLLIILQGCRKFAGIKPGRQAEYIAWLLVLVGMWYWTYPSDNLNARVVLVSAFHSYIYFSVAWVCYRIRPEGHFSYAYSFVCVATCIGGLTHAARGLAYGLGMLHQTHLLESSAATTLFLGLGVVALPCLAAGMVMLVHDRLVRRLEHLASVDELTGAQMRRSCLVQAERALRIAVRTGRPLSLAMIDLDRFKAINDSRGHAAGDRVLKHFGGLVGGSLRASDIFGRLGGEEFIVICPETTQLEGVKMLERMQRLIQTVPCMVDGEELPYTFSAGVGIYKPGESLADLMARVDETLYVAKSRGRDCIVEAPPDWRVDKATTVGADARSPAAGSAVEGKA